MPLNPVTTRISPIQPAVSSPVVAPAATLRAPVALVDRQTTTIPVGPIPAVSDQLTSRTLTMTPGQVRSVMILEGQTLGIIVIGGRPGPNGSTPADLSAAKCLVLSRDASGIIIETGHVTRTGAVAIGPKPDDPRAVTPGGAVAIGPKQDDPTTPPAALSLQAGPGRSIIIATGTVPQGLIVQGGIVVQGGLIVQGGRVTSPGTANTNPSANPQTGRVRLNLRRDTPQTVIIR